MYWCRSGCRFGYSQAHSRRPLERHNGLIASNLTLVALRSWLEGLPYVFPEIPIYNEGMPKSQILEMVTSVTAWKQVVRVQDRTRTSEERVGDGRSNVGLVGGEIMEV